jgi:hypothetical protein
VLAVIGSSRDAVSRSLAVGLTGLGIAGLVMTNVSLGAIGGSMAAAASPPPETAMSVGQTTSGPAIDDHRTEQGPEILPLILLSAVSVAAGGSLFGLRRLAARSRATR